MDLKKYIRSIKDYPKKGILFRDITTLIKNPEALKYTIDKINDISKKITFDKRFSEFLKLKSKLCNINKSSLSTEEKVDWTLIWAEMNGYLFNYKVLKPWERDPAFYKTIWTSRSDVPAHEGPSHHNLSLIHI